MPHGGAAGAAAAANLADQQERSSVGMSTRSKVPQSKSKGQFAGYGGDAPLQTSESRPMTRLDAPPNFKRGVARNVAFLKKTFNPTVIFDPLPPELKYTLTRNFGFFTKIFTLPFDKDGVKTVQESVGLGKN
jgi:hypothetical protein